MSRSGIKYPTDTQNISEPQNQEMGEFYAVKKRQCTDFETLEFMNATV